MMANCASGQLRLNLMGGLGNQLFQTFATIALCLEKGLSFKLIEPVGERHFALSFLGLKSSTPYGVTLQADNLIFQETSDCITCDFKDFTEQNFAYKKIEFHENHISLKGYFQSSLYFAQIGTVIKRFIRMSLPETEPKFQNLVHLRIGDYINLENRKVHPLVGNKYIIRGMNELAERDKWNAVTDSPNLAKILYLPSMLNGLKVPTRISNNLIDFSLMAHSKNLIISNSSYSWWAAYVSDAKVVAPHRWFTSRASSSLSTKDLYIDSWKVL